MGQTTQHKEDRCLLLSHVRNLKVTGLASMVLLGIRDSRYFPFILLLSPVYGSLLTVRYGCSVPSHHIPIPANRKEEEQEGCTISLKDISVYMPLARTQAQGHMEPSGEAGT